MGWFSSTPKTSRDYPAAGTSVTADPGRFRRHKTTGTRRAARQGQAWEDADRAQDRKGGWYRARKTR